MLAHHLTINKNGAKRTGALVIKKAYTLVIVAFDLIKLIVGAEVNFFVIRLGFI